MGNHRLAGIGACGVIVMLVHTGAGGQPCAPHWVERFPDGEMSNVVSALTVFDDGSGSGPALYAGGFFNVAGDHAVHRIARFDGGGWSPLGDGFGSSVNTIIGFDDGTGPALYAGGNFTTSGSIVVNRIARWDGTAWSALGMGFDGTVQALAVFDDGSGAGPVLHAGGSFTHSGPVEVPGVARWNGSSWEPLAGGIEDLVMDLAVFDDGSGAGPALYAAGHFTSAGGAAAASIARWDGESWSDVGGGTKGFFYDLEVFDDGTGSALYAGGSFNAVGGAEAANIARWDGSIWSALGTGTDDDVICLHAFDDGGGLDLYAGGLFTVAGGLSAGYVARWNGSSWSALAPGTDHWVWAIAGFDDGSGGGPDLYAGGSFHTAADVEANYVAKWDGSAWTSLSGGTNGAVYSMTVFDDGSGPGPDLFVGGEFNRAGGIRADRIARWDGEQWTAVGGGVGTFWGYVWALAAFDDGSGVPALYAGGSFDSAGGIPAQSIARCGGQSWSDVGGGVNGYVYELAVFDDGSGSGPALYAGGNFSSAGNLPTGNVARWDGTSWSALSYGPGGDVRALCRFDDGSGSGPQLYAGGSFPFPYFMHYGVARWDGSMWLGVGESKLMGEAWDLAIYDDGSGAGPALYAAGGFDVGGNLTTVARWDGESWTAVDGAPTDGWAFSIAVVNDGLDDHPALYVGGTFTHAGDVLAPLIARWNGTTWSAVGEGLQGPYVDWPMVTSLAVFRAGDRGPSLFAGGNFSRSSGLSAQNIAEWMLCVEAPPGDIDADTIVDLDDLLIRVLPARLRDRG